MKNRFLRVLALSLLSFAPIFAMGQSESFVSAPSQSQPMIVDTWGNVADNVGNVTDTLSTVGQTATGFLQNLLMDWRNGGDLTLKVSQCLEDLGLPAGRVLQASILKNVGEAIGKIADKIDAAVKIVKVADAIARGDKEAFKKAVSDALIDIVSKALGEAASKGTFVVLTGATVGWGALPAWAAGTLVGMGVEKLTKWLLDKYARGALENLLDRAWDFFAGASPGNGGPFDDPDPNPGPDPDSGPAPTKGYQGLKPIKLL